MKKIITSEDVAGWVRQGKTEVVLDRDHQLTDLAKEAAQRKRLRIIRREEAEAAPVQPVSAKRTELVPLQPVPRERTADRPVPRREPVRELWPPKAEDRPAAAPQVSYDLMIKNGTVVLPEAGCIRVNVCVKDGKIAALTTKAPSARQEIDAGGLYVLPGIVDPHTHLGLFAPLEQELVTETQSALLGGVTCIGTFFNHLGSYLPTIDMLEREVPARSRVDLFPHFTLREEAQLQELPLCSAKGMNSFKVYMCGIPGLFPHQEDGFILRAMRRLKELDADPILCVHAENASVVEYAEAEMDMLSVNTLEQWGRSHPNLAEGEAVRRAAYFARELDLRTYLVHMSCKESVEALRHLKHRNLFVETTSPYLSLDTADPGVGVLGKMLPPFREPESRQALWDAVREGIVDTIGTDNTTVSREEKRTAEGMGGAIAGYPALGTHLVSVLNEGFFKQEIPLDRLVPLMTMNPAKIFGIYPQKGTLLPGADADIVLVDMRSSAAVDPARLGSRSDFSIFQGKTLRAWPCGTVKGGRIMAWKGRLTDDSAAGRVLKHCMKEW